MISATTILGNLPTDVRINRLEALVEASESLNEASGVDDILLTILGLVSQQLDCERATLFLHDRRTGKLHARQMSGSQRIEIVLERGVGIAGFVAESGESVLINDVQADERFDRATDERTGFNTRTMLCVPLRRVGGELLGSLQAINSRAEVFSEVDLAYLESFAALAALAVERERLAQEAVRAELLSTELELARKIQQRLLPPLGSIKLEPPFSAWGVSQSCFDVGGDSYDALVLPSGELAFWVADVSGKGIGAALLMTTLQTELRALVHIENDLAKLAAELNTRVTHAAPMGTYATMFLGVVNPNGERMRYINAGHLPPVWTGKREAAFCDCSTGGMPIGLLPGSSYETGETIFRKDERLAVFSDGVTDAENIDQETYETAGVLRAVERTSARDVAEIGHLLFADLDRFRMGAQEKDDTTLLVVGLS